MKANYLINKRHKNYYRLKYLHAGKWLDLARDEAPRGRKGINFTTDSDPLNPERGDLYYGLVQVEAGKSKGHF